MNDVMPRYRRVLVPLDGSPASETIIPFVLGIAGPLDLQIVLVRVVSSVWREEAGAMPHIIVQDVAARRAEARDYLAAIAADLSGRGVRVQVDIRIGMPATAIVSATHEHAADMIAMTTQGPSGRRRMFGSVAESVLRLAPCPVLLIRFTAAEARTRPGHEVMTTAIASGDR